jgi:hypothetical protein
MEMNTPAQLVHSLIMIFPEFTKEWDKGESYGCDRDYNFHTVLLAFAPVSHAILSGAAPGQIKKFCELINLMVEIPGEIENAVATCFLEHASQVGVHKIIEPYLSKKAKQELR